MKNPKILVFSLLVASIAFTSCKKNDSPFTLQSADITTVFTSENFGNGSYGTCTGSNKSPQLSWSNAPSGTKSFAVTIIDPTAFGANAPFDHWLMINIPTSVNALAKDAGNISGANAPIGALQTPNGAFAYDTIHPAYYKAYAGVCPNVSSTRQYEVTVYALNTAALNVSPDAHSTAVKAAINAATISTAKMTVSASR